MSNFNNNELNFSLNSILEQSLIDVQGLFRGFAFDLEFDDKIRLAFVNHVDLVKAKVLIGELAKANSSSLPKFEIRSSSEINGAFGAFARANNTIYISREFLSEKANDIPAITAVLIEELGHFIDSQLNTSDTPGDEGELFSNLVRRVTLSDGELQRIKAEDDSAVVTIDGKTFEVEQYVPDPQDYPTLPQDLRALDAHIVNGQLLIEFILSSSADITSIELFLDTDQNPFTGDIRIGHLGGAEYRISAQVQELNYLPDYIPDRFPVKDYSLNQLPRTNEEVTLFQNLPGNINGGITSEKSLLINRPINVAGKNHYWLSVPLDFIGNPRDVDVIAIAHRNQAYNQTGLGDRAPNYGVIDTSTRQLVLRRNAGFNSRDVADSIRDNPGLAPDIVSANFTTTYDQFRIALTFTQPINPLAVGFEGEIVLDTDRDLLTGDIPMGGEIATWGGDIRLFFNFNAGQATFLLQDNALGSVPFGSDRNDGRWLIQGNSLILEGSLSLFDAYSIKANSSGSGYTRVLTDGRMNAQVSSIYATQNGLQRDLLTPFTTAVDTATGQFLPSFTWDPSKTVSTSDTDPVDLGLYSGIDLTRVDTQVINNHLMVKGFLRSWINSDDDNLFEILLDTDMNLNTGFRGAEYKIEAYSTSSVHIPFYGLVVHKYNSSGQLQETSAHSALFTQQFGTPGSFTVNIPLKLLDNLGPQLRLAVFTYKHDGASSAGGGGAIWLGKELGFYNLNVLGNSFDSSPLINVNLSGSAPATTLAIARTNANQPEGNNGTKPFTFTVTRSENLNKIDTVNWIVTGTVSNSVNATDFAGSFPSGILTFNSGESFKTITVNVSGDTTIESDETFAVTLSNPSNGATISTATAIGTILNDDNSTGTPGDNTVNNDNFANRTLLTGNNLSVTGTNVGFTGETGEPVQQGTINSAWWSWTAPQSSVVTIDTNGSSFDTFLSVFTGDTINSLVLKDKNDDGIGIGLASQVSFAAVAGTTYQIAVDGYSQETGNITLNIDQGSSSNTSFAITATNANRNEGNSGVTPPTPFVFTIIRNGNASGTNTVEVSVTGIGTNAANALDLGEPTLPFGTVLTFNPGERSKQISVEVTGDTMVELDETFEVTLSNANNGATITTAKAIGTILNDDVVGDGQIRGVKWNDLDGDGTKDAGEPELQGWTIYLDANKNGQLDTGETSTMTDASGNYAFTNLTPATYIVAEVLQSGWQQTYPTTSNQNSFRLLSTASNGSNFNLIELQRNPFAKIPIGSTAQSSGLDVNPTTGFLYGALESLFRINPTDGSSTTIGPISSLPVVGSPPLEAMTSIAFDPDGTLYGVSLPNQRLYTIDLSNGFATEIGTTTAWSIDFAPDGTLYGVSGDSNLVKLNPATGGVLATVGATGITGVDIDFAPDGFIYGSKVAEKELYRIDPSNASTTLIGAYDSTPLGVASIPSGSGIPGTHSVVLNAGQNATGINFGNRQTVLPSITLAVNPATVTEDGTTNLVYTFTRMGGSTASPLSVNYTVGGTATFNSDYIPTGTANFNATTGTITFAAGSATAQLTVNPTPDTTVELNETVTLTLASGTGYTVGATSTATGTITDDDQNQNIPTPGNDSLTGGSGNDTINALAGNDTINGGAGNDRLYGGSGNDTLNGEAGLDGLSGGEGNDSLLGGDGNDGLRGDLGNDTLNGGAGTDTVVETGNLNFTLNNTQLIGNGTDALISIEQANLTGGIGNNLLNASGFTSGAVTLNGGDGNDRLYGGSGNDNLNGGVGNDGLSGGAGNDSLDGGLGNDGLRGDLGNDTLNGGAGNDIVVETGNLDFTLNNTQLIGNGTDTLISIEQANLTGGIGNNSLNATAFTLGSLTLNGGNGNDTLRGGSANDSLNGGVGIDGLSGGSGNDYLTGGDGNDGLRGDAGNDTLTGGIGSDRFILNAPTQGIDKIDDFSVFDDTIAVSAVGFRGGLVANQAIKAEQFVIGSGATNTSQRFIYNSTTGGLFFDVDGMGGTAQIQIATLNIGLAMTNNDISAIA